MYNKAKELRFTVVILIYMLLIFNFILVENVILFVLKMLYRPIYVCTIVKLG